MEIARVGVVGAGFMGSGIAESAASAGIDVTVFEPEQAPLDRSRSRLQVSVERGVSRGKLSSEQAEGLPMPSFSQDRSGFIVNMLLVPYLMAAVRMYEDGFASREDIDQGMQLGCGHPMGPLTLCDFIGLDVLYAVCDSLYEEFKRPEYAPPPLLKRMVVSGHHGRKAGQGFYSY